MHGGNKNGYEVLDGKSVGALKYRLENSNEINVRG